MAPPYEPDSASKAPLPELAAPARRALRAAGIDDLDELASRRADEVAKLHGMGAAAMRRLHEALAEHGRSFAGDEDA